VPMEASMVARGATAGTVVASAGAAEARGARAVRVAWGEHRAALATLAAGAALGVLSSDVRRDSSGPTKSLY